MALSKFYIVIIGVAEYQDSDITPIPNIRANIRGLLDLFNNKSLTYLSDIEISLCGTNFRNSLRNKRQIEEIVEKAFYDANNSSCGLLIYYAGHGLISKDSKLYFATYDTKQNLEKSSAIHSSFITDGFKKCNAGQKILILDCCYSAKALDGMAASPIESAINISLNNCSGTYIVTATDSGHKAEFDELDPKRPTDFTEEFLRVVENGISNDREYLSIGEVFERVISNFKATPGRPCPEQYNYNDGHKITLFKNNGFSTNDVEQQLFQKVIKGNSLNDLADFRKKFPHSQFLAKISERHKEITLDNEFEVIKLQRSSKKLLKFLKKHPISRYTVPGKQLLIEFEEDELKYRAILKIQQRRNGFWKYKLKFASVIIVCIIFLIGISVIISRTDYFKAFQNSISVDAADNSDKKTTFKIGCILPLSGSNSELGRYAKSGIEKSLDFVNTSRYTKINIEMDWADSQMEPGLSVDHMYRMIKDTSIKVIIGPFSTREAFHCTEIANNKRILMILPSTNLQGESNKDDYVYQTSTSTDQQGDYLTDLIRLTFKKNRILIVLSEDQYGNALSQRISNDLIKNRSDANEIKTIAVSPQIENIAEVVYRYSEIIYDENAVIIFLLSYIENTNTLLKPLSERQAKCKIVIKDSRNSIDRIVAEVNPRLASDLNKIYFLFPSKLKSSRASNIYSISQNSIEQDYYESMNLVADAINLNGYNVEKIREYFKTINGSNPYEGMTRTIEFDKNGNIINRLSMFLYTEGKVIKMKEININ